MKNIKRCAQILLCLLFFWLCGKEVLAREPVRRDASSIRSRYFDEQKIRRLKSDPDFRYEMLKEPPKSLWQRFWAWFWSKVRDMLSSRRGRNTFKVTLLIVALAVLLLFIYQLRKMNAAGMFTASNPSQLKYRISEDDINSIDFRSAIDNAVSEGNYRLAVRLLYLQSLKFLSDGAHINWRVDKTNVSYLQEVQEADFYPLFHRLTLQFEKNWYGDIAIHREEFEQVQDQFKSLHHTISK